MSAVGRGDLRADVLPVSALTEQDVTAMHALMVEVYDGVTRAAFDADLASKDECITLRTESGELVGFSTQRFLSVSVDGTSVAGVFSGDTVIHPDHWGSPALFQAFARRYITDRDPPLWWFLISKGHRTYRMLPVFFTEFLPDRRRPTPKAAKALMDAYARLIAPDAYDADAGVLRYRTPKDRLRPGLAGVTEHVLRNPDAAHFATLNPGHERGDDLVCLCELTPANLRERMRPLLLGTTPAEVQASR